MISKNQSIPHSLFLQITANISLSYMQQLPGLVHFILVDRTSSRLLAPSITELFGQMHQGRGPQLAEAQKSFLRKHVWKLAAMVRKKKKGRSIFFFYKLLKALELWPSSSTYMIRRDDFVYYHNIWCQDADGHVLPLAQDNLPSDLSQDVEKYAALSSAKNGRVFEIYGLFVATLSSPTLKKYSELLLESLVANFPAFFGDKK